MDINRFDVCNEKIKKKCPSKKHVTAFTYKIYSHKGIL